MKMTVIGNNLRRIRSKRGITQIDLSKITGITNAYISKVENGIKKNPSSIILNKLAKALNCSTNDLTNKYNSDEIKEPSIKDVVNELIITKQHNSDESTVAGLILEKLRNENKLDENFKFTPKIKELIEEAIKLDAKFNNNIKKGAK